MSAQPGVDAPIGLDNCDREPIHIPGAIQPHGALLAFDRGGRLVACSANAESLLGRIPARGEAIDDSAMPAGVREALNLALASGERDAVEVELEGGRLADLSTHMSEELLVAEFEPRGDEAPRREKFAAEAQRALERIQRQETLAKLLDVATEEIARLSGFDRVMAYRFRHDDSGEVVSECMRHPLESYLGLRYPASDIPAQARRLYVLNPLRLIVDLRYKPVPIVPAFNPVTHGPIDLSFSVLRSVSPIHVEYLTNMGVFASMSISILVQGRLWGLFACHHYSAHFVPHSKRMSCHLLSQVVSVLVERVLVSEHARSLARGARVRAALAERAQAEDDIVHALATGETHLMDLVPCSGAAVSSLSQIASIGEAPGRAQVARAIAWLNNNARESTWHSSRLRADAPALAEACEGFAGLCAIRFSTEPNSWVLWFRREERAAVRWAGRPGKEMVSGPNGSRLSPRGSFAEWREEVRDRSAPWDAAELETIGDARRALREISAAKLQDVVRAREAMLAMLGHDLRNPLQAITMAGEILRRDGSQVPRVHKQIASSAGRMSRLIAHALDMSRLQAGHGLGVIRERHDLGMLLEGIVAEARTAYPGAELAVDVAQAGEAWVDSDRIEQVFSNLLSNARHHGKAGHEVKVAARRVGDRVVITVANHADPLPEGVMKGLFEPFKRASLENPNNPRGMGLGLYIAASIVREHGGTLDSDSRDGVVTFTVSLPAGPPAP